MAAAERRQVARHPGHLGAVVDGGADLHPLVAPGLWERLHRLARERQRPELGLVFLDGTVIRAHQKAAGAKRGR